MLPHSVDRHVCRTFFDVANLLRPATTLFAPSVMARIARVCMAPESKASQAHFDSKGRLLETTLGVSYQPPASSRQLDDRR